MRKTKPKMKMLVAIVNKIFWSLFSFENCDRGQQSRFYATSRISYAIHHRQLVTCSFNSFWTTLHEYVPYRSIGWQWVGLHTPAQDLWDNLCIKKIEEVLTAAVAFQAKIREEILPNFQADKIFYIDQYGINYELHSGHILSFCVEKSTKVLSKNLNSFTHCYKFGKLWNLSLSKISY